MKMKMIGMSRAVATQATTTSNLQNFTQQRIAISTKHINKYSTLAQVPGVAREIKKNIRILKKFKKFDLKK